MPEEASGSHGDHISEGGANQEKCPYCKGTFPKNLPLVNGDTQLQRHIKVFHPQFAMRKS